MSLIAELTLRELQLFEPTFAAVPDAACRFEDIHYVKNDDGSRYYVFFWQVSGCTRSDFEAAIDADPTVHEYRLVAVLDNRDLYRIVTREFPPEQPLVYPAFREHDMTAIESRRDAEGLHLRTRVPNRDALQKFLDDARSMASSVEVRQLYAEESIGETDESLTAKQREALALAYEHGYFATPSQVTLETLADELDITPQTLSRHVRTGVQKLVGRAVGPSRQGPDDF